MKRRLGFALCAVLAAALLWPAGTVGETDVRSPLSVQSIVVEKIPFSVKVEDPGLESVPFALMLLDDEDEVVFHYNGIIPATVRNVRVPATGDYQIILTTAGRTWENQVRSLAGLVTVLPGTNGFAVVELDSVVAGELDGGSPLARQQYERIIANGNASLEAYALIRQLRATAEVEVFEERIQ